MPSNPSYELISRDALERIIQHAAELQANERDIGEGLSRAELLALGKEVGIPERYLLQALLDEETRTVAPVGRGLGQWLVGPPALVATRVVPGERAAVERALATWLEREELLQVKRRFPDSTTWEAKAGAFASLQRALGAGGKRFVLARTAEVAVSVIQLEAGFCHVRLRADVSNQRRQRMVGAGTLLTAAVAAAAGAGPLLGFIAFWPYLPAAVLAVAGTGYARGHQRDNERMQIALEQVLDRLERGDVRPEARLGRGSPAAAALGRIADELKRTLEF